MESPVSRISHPPNRTLRRALKALLIMVAASVTFIASAFTAWAASDITITFVRHGESYGNTSCCLSTAPPGPELTDTGLTQADLIGQALADDGIDYTSIYDSGLTRTQQTAAKFANDTGLTPTTLSGLNEVNAGIYEGASQTSGIQRILYALAPFAWALGMYSVPIPGSPDATGANFESRFNAAVQEMYNNGGDLPVAFSHGMAIMAWTLMNVKNPDVLLMFTDTLSNTDTVTVTGNPTDGWTLVSWNGKAVSQNPNLLTKLMVNVRDLVATPQMALYNFGQALRTGNIASIANAIRDGVFDTVKAAVNFPINVVKSVVKSITTGTVFKSAAPPADASVPPTGSDLGAATGVPTAATSDSGTTGTVAAAATSMGSKVATTVSDKSETVAAVSTESDKTATVETSTKSAQESTTSTDTSATSDTKADTDTKADKSDAKADAKADTSEGTKAKHAHSSDSTAASQKSGSAKSDSSDSTKSDTTKKKKSGKKGGHKSKAGASSGSSSSGKSGSSSGHHGGSK
jgi:broad specificity phosphatase PhoE